MYHIENQLEEQADLAEGDRRALVEQLQALTQTPDSDDVNRRQIRAVGALKKLAPRAWQAALPALQVILTAEAKRQLSLPP